jgi:hypothetical protein
MCPVDDGDDDPDFVAHASVPEEEAAGGKRKRSNKMDPTPNKHRKLSEENQSGKSSKRNKLEPSEESGMSSFLRPNTSLRLPPEIPNPLPMLLKLQGSAVFADEVPRIEKRGSGQLAKVKRKTSPVASASQPVRHKVAVIMPPIDSDVTGTPEIHPYLRFTIDGGLPTLEPESEGEPPVRRGINTPDRITPVDDDATEPESDAGQPKLRRPLHSTNLSASPSRRALSSAIECSETEPETDSDGDIHPSQADESLETVPVRSDEDEGEGEDDELYGEIEYCPVSICILRSSLALSSPLPSTMARNLIFRLLQPRHYAVL